MPIIGGTYKLNSGYEIPLIGFGSYDVKDQESVNTVIDAALAAGYRLFDTAQKYENEQQIGKALHELAPKYHLKRSDLFITTKIPLKLENNTEATRVAVEKSLKALNVDYIDLLLIHFPRSWDEGATHNNPNNATHRKDTYLELEKLKEEGKIHSIGISNYEIRHIEELKQYATIPPAVNQCEFHPHFTRNELREYCKKENIFFQAFTSLGRRDPTLVNDPIILSLAEKHKTPVHLILLAYAFVQGVGIIPKSATPSRIKENIQGTVEVKLTREEVEQLNGLNKDMDYNRDEQGRPYSDGWNVL